MPFSPKPRTNSSPRPHGLSRSHTISLGGLALVPDLSGALYVPDYATLLVADLHLEKGTSLAKRGVHLPPYDTRESLRQLAAVIAATEPQRLIFLGDSFHDGAARERIDAADLASLRAITTQVETIWITGNHDPEPPQMSAAPSPSKWRWARSRFAMSRNRWATDEIEISGHLHPAASVIVARPSHPLPLLHRRSSAA